MKAEVVFAVEGEFMNQLPLDLQPAQSAYRLIPLGRTGHFAKVDAEDYDWLMQWKWTAKKDSRSASYYATRQIGERGNNHTLYMAREIMRNPPDLEVDHRNHDCLDNRRANLRAATRTQNNRNERIRVDNTSGHKGVTWHRKTRKWRAQINISGKRTSLGYFSNLRDAAMTYANAAKEEHGEFICLEAK